MELGETIIDLGRSYCSTLLQVIIQVNGIWAIYGNDSGKNIGQNGL